MPSLFVLYGKRSASPYINHFIQPDTVIPDQANPQSWNRYGYVLNNPILHNDPEGHCPWCVSAVVGAAIGFGISYGTQVYKNTQSGMKLSDAMNWKNFDTDAKTKIVAATVGGLVAGATMGLAAPALAGALTTEVAGYGIAGAAANTLGGIAESLTVASAKQVQNSKAAGSWTWDGEQFKDDAAEAGLTAGNIAFNLGTGGLLSMGFYPLTRALTGPIRRIPNAMFFDDTFYEARGAVVGFGAAAVKTVTGLLQQKLQNDLNDSLKERPEHGIQD